MDNNNIYPISLEKFAAFLDGTLSHDEMESIGKLAQSDDTLRALIDLSESIDESESLSDGNVDIPDMSDLEIPSLEGKWAPDDEDVDDLTILKENTASFTEEEKLDEKEKEESFCKAALQVLIQK